MKELIVMYSLCVLTTLRKEIRKEYVQKLRVKV